MTGAPPGAPPSATLRLALLQYPVERPEGVAAFAARLDRWLAEVAGRADLAVLPEYACVELGAGLAEAAGHGAVDEAGELAVMVEAAPAILDAMRGAARRAGLWLLPGTLPMRDAEGRVRNRAPLIAPDGRMAFQEKRIMTRFEKERWLVSPGDPPGVFDTPWGRIGVSVCYDVEFPQHVRAQTEAGAWLILAPSCTDTMHGFHRVRVGAAARAMENQCYVAITPTVGEAPWSAALDVNRGHAAVFGPIDRGFPEDGVLARGALDQPGWVLATLDPVRLETVRRDGGVRNFADRPRAPIPDARPVPFA